MGGNISTAQAYIADATTPENRARGMGLIGAAFGLGFVLGPAIASGLIHPEFRAFFDAMGFSGLAGWMDINRFGLPGFFAAFLSFCSFLLVWFKLPETVDKNRQQTEKTTYRPTVFTARFWQNISRQNKASGSSVLSLLLFAGFLLSFGQASLYSAFPLFCEAVLDMSPEQVGMQFFYIGLIAVIVQGGLIKPLTRWFSEEKLFLTGNILMTLGLGAITFAGTISMLTFFLGIMALGHSLNLPTLSSLISQEADAGNVGAMMGTSQGLSGLGRAIGPTWGGFLFSVSFGLPFLATALVMLATVYVGLRLVRKKRPAGEKTLP
ncbi:MAG: MFS transporter, partial [Balneolales bacterium]